MPPISPLRRRMIEDMTIRNLSPATQPSYGHAVSRFSRYFGRSPDRLGLEDVRAYQVHPASKGVAWASLNQAVCALRFFYGVTLGEQTIPERIAYAREPRKLPVVLGADEVVRFVESVSSLKARVALTTAYAAGLLPVPCFHVVFTLPPAAAEIAFQSKQTVYGPLMRAAAEALMTLAVERLGARIGLIALLHTRGQTLTHHPHVHCLVPGGGVALDTQRWVACKPNFLLSVRALSKAFRRLFLNGLEAAFRRGELGFFGDLAPLAETAAFAERLRALRNSPFVVHAKPPFGGPARVLAYLARYTHRTAVANSRLVALDDDGVAFSYKDYRRSGRSRVMRLAPHQFIRRFLLHLLPDGFHRIRHYGFLAKGDRGENLARVRELLKVQRTQEPADQAQPSTTSEPEANPDAREAFAVCPDCGGLMRPIGRVAPHISGAFRCDTS
jgi:Putative transposase/Phage integrase, N-terminal SAM-like domain